MLTFVIRPNPMCDLTLRLGLMVAATGHARRRHCSAGCCGDLDERSEEGECEETACFVEFHGLAACYWDYAR